MRYGTIVPFSLNMLEGHVIAGPFPYYHTFTVDIDKMTLGSSIFKYCYSLTYLNHLLVLITRHPTKRVWQKELALVYLQLNQM